MPESRLQLTDDPSAFPSEPPADLDDPLRIAAHDLAAFAAVDIMLNHWDRPGWSEQTRAYYWMLTFPNAPALTDLARHCHHRLAPLGLDPVPLDALHTTLTRVAHSGELPPERLDALLQATALALPPAFTVHGIPLAGSRGAVRLSLAPWTPILRLHAALSDAMITSGLAPRKPTALLRPHLSLAYNNRQRPAAPVIDAVATLRDLPPVDLPVRDVQLVELRRENRAYRWDVIKSLPLS
ncbi:2'-5' RNA ligase family protein [Streptomyces sp. NPDC005373]|uniref:2'-5' RNA ligase family protein n=1 Tax=Streptomyces sp. NPDC005373 TaxID=3156879 RepID=UPI0033BE4B77